MRSSKRGKDKRLRRAKKRGEKGTAERNKIGGARSANHNDCANVLLQHPWSALLVMSTKAAYRHMMQQKVYGQILGGRGG